MSPLLKELHSQFLLTDVSTTRRWRRVTSPPSSNIGYRQRLRLSSSAMFNVLRTKHVTIGGRAFNSSAARVWNSLPTAVQSSESLEIFRRCVKTELFACSCNRHHVCQMTLLLCDSLSLSLSTIMLLWDSFLIIIIIIHWGEKYCNILKCYFSAVTGLVNVTHAQKTIV